MSREYPSVPAPRENIESLSRTVSALYQGYNALIGVPRNTDLTVLNQRNVESLTNEDPNAYRPVISNAEVLDGLLYDNAGAWVNTNTVTVSVCMATLTGSGASSPTINSSFNIASVSRTGVGAYTCTLTTSYYMGLAMLSNAVASVNVISGVNNGGGATETVHKTATFSLISAAGGTFSINVFHQEVGVTGQSTWLQDVADDLDATDKLMITILRSGITSTGTPT
tara:strand:+ start:4457 stop:5131 length:675 start_codon:yes stop_codon:yes gene_type:complete